MLGEQPAGTPSSSLLDLVGVGHDAAEQHVGAPGTPASRAATRPAVQHSAVASVRPARAARRARRLQRGRPLGEDRAPEPLAQRGDQALGGARRGLGDGGSRPRSRRATRRWSSRMPPASPPRSSNASATVDSGTPNTRSTLRGSPPASSGASSGLATAVGHIRGSSTGGPGSTTMRWSPTGDDHAGRGAHGRQHLGAGRHGGLLAVPARDSRRVDAARARELRHDRVDLRQRRLVEHQLDARHARHAGHGAVVVRRPEAAGGDDEVDAARSSPDSAATISSSRSSTATIRSSRTP